MLTENDVVDAVCESLREEGLVIIQALDTSQRGVDVIAESPDGACRVLVEAKGQTSSKPATRKYGRRFSPAQVHTHVSKALFKAVELLPAEPDGKTRVVIALPKTRDHTRQIDKIRHALPSLGIEVWIVDSKLRVDRSI